MCGYLTFYKKNEILHALLAASMANFLLVLMYTIIHEFSQGKAPSMKIIYKSI